MDNSSLQRIVDEFDIEYQTAIQEKSSCAFFSTSGIYFLICNNEIVFIGYSEQIVIRVGQHWTQKEKEFDSFSFIECTAENANLLQAHFICKFKPKYNTVLPTQEMFKSLSQLKLLFNINLSSLKKFIRLNNIKDHNGFYKLSDFGGL